MKIRKGRFYFEAGHADYEPLPYIAEQSIGLTLTISQRPFCILALSASIKKEQYIGVTILNVELVLFID